MIIKIELELDETDIYNRLEEYENLTVEDVENAIADYISDRYDEETAMNSYINEVSLEEAYTHFLNLRAEESS